jgi:hypothetical protein
MARSLANKQHNICYRAMLAQETGSRSKKEPHNPVCLSDKALRTGPEQIDIQNSPLGGNEKRLWLAFRVDESKARPSEFDYLGRARAAALLMIRVHTLI